MELEKEIIDKIEDYLKALKGATLYRIDNDLLQLVPVECRSAFLHAEQSENNQFGVSSFSLEINVDCGRKKFLELNKEVFVNKEDAVKFITNKFLTNE